LPDNKYQTLKYSLLTDTGDDAMIARMDSDNRTATCISHIVMLATREATVARVRTSLVSPHCT